MVTHPSTTQAQRCLTLEIRRDPVVLNRNHAFFFCDLVSLKFLMVSVVSRIFLAAKIETLGGFMKPDKKINWNLSGAPLGPRAGAEAGAEARGPSGVPERFQFFLCQVSWIPPKVFNFSCQNIREYQWNHQKYQWNPGHKIKKICVVFIEIPFWWYFCQKCGGCHCILNVINCTKILMYWYQVQ